MSKYNPDIHHRRSIRLKNFDYSQAGLYFVTICIQNRDCLFGEIFEEEMKLNEMGEIAHKEWLKTVELRKNVQLHEFAIMPNHFHAIVEITGDDVLPVGATRALPLQHALPLQQITDVPHRARHALPLRTEQSRFQNQGKNTLSSIVGAYKSAVSRQLGFSVWQRNFYEHIIRNTNDYERIANYIATNPSKWIDDTFYKE